MLKIISILPLVLIFQNQLALAQAGANPMSCFMKIGSDFASDEGWLPLTAVQFGAGRAISSPQVQDGGSKKQPAKVKPRMTSAASWSEITVTRKVDATTVDMFGQVDSSKPFSVGIRCKDGRGKMGIEYRLGGALVSGLSVSAGEKGSGESLSLNYNKIEILTLDSSKKVEVDLSKMKDKPVEE